MAASPTIKSLETQRLGGEWDAFVAKLLNKRSHLQLTSLGIPQLHIHGGLNNCPLNKPMDPGSAITIREKKECSTNAPLGTVPRDRQPPTATNHQPPPTPNHQPPIANHQPPPTTANCRSPPTMVEHMSYTRHFCKTAILEHFPPPPLGAPCLEVCGVGGWGEVLGRVLGGGGGGRSTICTVFLPQVHAVC